MQKASRGAGICQMVDGDGVKHQTSGSGSGDGYGSPFTSVPDFESRGRGGLDSDCQDGRYSSTRVVVKERSQGGHKRINAASSSRRLCGRAFRLPTRLADGFGLEALPACGWIHPGWWQAIFYVGSPVPRRRGLGGKAATNWRHRESTPVRVHVNVFVRMRLTRNDSPERTINSPACPRSALWYLPRRLREPR